MTTTETRPAAPTASVQARGRVSRDLILVAIVAAAVVVIGWWGRRLERHGSVILLHGGEPLAGPLQLRINRVTAFAVVLALAYLLVLPWLTDRVPWRPLLAVSALVQAAWATLLALTDGVHKGLIDRLTPKDEYLHDIHRFSGPLQLLREFTTHIATPTGADQWATHVGGHPPGAVLTFWALDRVGLTGGGWAAALCIAGGALSVPAVLVTVRAVQGEHAARAVMPFLGTIPAVVWIAASADAWFLGVTAWGIAALALAARSRGPRADLLAAGAGLLLGYGIFLSYGLVLLVPLMLAVAWRRPRALVVAAGVVVVMVAAAAAAGFWWYAGLRRTGFRVHVGAAGDRPFGYFVLANLAALAIALGPAALVGLRRLRLDPLGRLWSDSPRRLRLDPLGRLVGAALLAVAVADLSGLARGEVERIWLPFMPWILAAVAYVPAPHRRWWLAGQLGLGILVQSVVVSLW